MIVGNTCEVVDQEVCEETYTLVRNHQSVRSRSDALTFPSAKKYVQRLLLEVPEATQPLKQRLAVVTGVCKGSVGYYVAEELAAAAQMDLVLVGCSFAKLEIAAQGITDECKRRNGTTTNEDKNKKPPKLHMIPMDKNSLKSVKSAADEIAIISKLHYQGQVHILVNLGGEVSEFYSRTEDGVEVNLGRNYLAPRLLADSLLPQLRAAASDDYKPRLIQEASVGHCVGVNFDPYKLQKSPKEGGGGCKEETSLVIRNKETQELEYASISAGVELFYRSKMALMADALGLAQEEPMLAVVSCDPGILSYATPPPNVRGTRKSLSSRVLDLSPSQAARSILRAALDPTFNNNNTDDATEMYYLHSDGNLWRMAKPTALECSNDLEEYAEIVRSVGDEFLGQLLADKECEWELYNGSSSSTKEDDDSLLGYWSPLSSPTVSPVTPPMPQLSHDDVVTAVPAPPLTPETTTSMSSSSAPVPSSQPHSSILKASSRVLWGRAFTSLLSQ